jgi:hypothetical protein
MSSRNPIFREIGMLVAAVALIVSIPGSASAGATPTAGPRHRAVQSNSRSEGHGPDLKPEQIRTSGAVGGLHKHRATSAKDQR